MNRNEAEQLMQTCLRDPRTKLSPAACAKRRNIITTKDYAKMSEQELGIVVFCRGCKGLPMSPAPKSIKADPKEPQELSLVSAVKTCSDCGKDFQSYKHGFTWPDICRECFGERVRRGTSRAALERRVTEMSLLIDFSQEDRPLLELLKELAKRERRTPEMQAVCILEQALNEAIS